MKKRLLSILTATIVAGGMMCKPAFAVENTAPKLEENLEIVNEQCEEIEVDGVVVAIYYIIAPEDGIEGEFLAASNGQSYIINGYDIGKHMGKKIRVKGCLISTKPNTIQAVEVEVLD